MGAQTFANFGSQVTVLEVSPKVLPREDADAAAIVQKSLQEDGVKFILGISELRFASSGQGDHGFSITKALFNTDADGECELDSEVLLIATGREPNVEGIGLEVAGVEYSTRFGIPVDDLMVTSNPNVYAIGDCSSKWQFTHMAGTQAQMVIDNAVFGDTKKVSDLVIPRCTYTSPEVAGTGLSEAEMKEQGIEYETFTSQLAHVDRAILESGDEGFCKIHVKKDTGVILGATIVAEAAGELISELTLAINAGVELGTIAKTIHPYPTVAEAIAGCAFQYKTRHWQTK